MASSAAREARLDRRGTVRSGCVPSLRGEDSMNAQLTLPSTPAQDWHACRFLTCSVLPVRMACNLRCPFCFSKSSVSSLAREPRDLETLDVGGYYRFARERGATRLVITGGGEPLLRPELVVRLVREGRRVFDEVACFT